MYITVHASFKLISSHVDPGGLRKNACCEYQTGIASYEGWRCYEDEWVRGSLLKGMELGVDCTKSKQDANVIE